MKVLKKSKQPTSKAKEVQYLCWINQGFFQKQRMALVLEPKTFYLHVISIANSKIKQASNNSFKIYLARSKIKANSKDKALMIQEFRKQQSGKFSTKKHKLSFYQKEHLIYWEQLIKQTQEQYISSAFKGNLEVKGSIDKDVLSSSEKDDTCSNFLRIKKKRNCAIANSYFNLVNLKK